MKRPTTSSPRKASENQLLRPARASAVEMEQPPRGDSFANAAGSGEPRVSPCSAQPMSRSTALSRLTSISRTSAAGIGSKRLLGLMVASQCESEAPKALGLGV